MSESIDPIEGAYSSHMVRVQMRAQYDVDVLGADADSAQTFEIARLFAFIPFRRVRPRFVFADAAVNQDDAAVDAQHEALHSQQHALAREVDVVRIEQRAILGKRLKRRIRKAASSAERRTDRDR